MSDLFAFDAMSCDSGEDATYSIPTESYSADEDTDRYRYRTRPRFRGESDTDLTGDTPVDCGSVTWDF